MIRMCDGADEYSQDENGMPCRCGRSYDDVERRVVWPHDPVIGPGPVIRSDGQAPVAGVSMVTAGTPDADVLVARFAAQLGALTGPDALAALPAPPSRGLVSADLRLDGDRLILALACDCGTVSDVDVTDAAGEFAATCDGCTTVRWMSSTRTDLTGGTDAP